MTLKELYKIATTFKAPKPPGTPTQIFAKSPAPPKTPTTVSLNNLFPSKTLMPTPKPVTATKIRRMLALPQELKHIKMTAIKRLQSAAQAKRALSLIRHTMKI